MDEKLSRRDILHRSAALGVFALVGTPGCKEQPKALSCSDTMSLSPADAQVRTSLLYVDKSVEPGKSCSGCLQFLPGPPDACGNCKVLKGPINPSGYCKSFAPKAV
jgi:hypothetical protein